MRHFAQYLIFTCMFRLNVEQSTPDKKNNYISFQRFMVLLLFVTCIQLTESEVAKAVLYLSKYGYLPQIASNPVYGRMISKDVFSDALREFQSFGGLNVTGILDEATLKLMGTPRCGRKDRIYGAHERKKKFAVHGTTWTIRNMTFRLYQYPKSLMTYQTELALQNAFNLWREPTILSFQREWRKTPSIKILFVSREHDDCEAFDGPGGTLAHTFYPIEGGDVHFDDDELWTDKSKFGVNLFQVAAHEIGHALGLAHTDVPSAVMGPFYSGYRPIFKLDEDDINGIQFLYGNKSGKAVNTTDYNSILLRDGVTDKFHIPNAQKICTSFPPMDTIFRNYKKNIYVFRGEKYWKLTKKGIEKGYPKYISQKWPGVPSKIDAAFHYIDKRDYFFKHDKVWRFSGKKLDKGYPKYMFQCFKGIPDNIDAALVRNKKLYFFKGSMYWMFGEPSSSKSYYPRPISKFKGIPNKLTAAMFHNGHSYFFKDDQYWRFNDKLNKVDSDKISFPRSFRGWWLRCKPVSSKVKGKL